MLKSYFVQQTTHWNKRLISLILFSSAVFYLINYYYFHYQPVQYLPWSVAIGMVIILLLLQKGVILLFGPKTAFQKNIVRLATIYGLLLLLAIYTSAVQLTPFLPIDRYLLAMDKWLGFNTLAAIKFSHQHPNLLFILENAYALMNLELSAALLTLVIFPSKKKQDPFIFLLLFSALIGFTLYYFLPTLAPAGILDSPYFLDEQKQTAIKFFDVHQGIEHTSIAGGLIAMPSFHCIWALLCQWYFFRWPLVAYLLLPLNILILMACFMLGWHYFVDILASILIVYFSITVKRLIVRDRNYDSARLY